MGRVLTFSQRTQTLSPSTPATPAHSIAPNLSLKRMAEQLEYLSITSAVLVGVYGRLFETAAREHGWRPRRSGGAA